MRYLPLLFYENPEIMKYYRETLQVMNNDLIEERATSYDGMIVNTILKLHEDGYTGMTASDIAHKMMETYGLERVTSQSIGRHLKSLGLKTKQKTIQGKTQRLLIWDDALMSRLRARYQIKDNRDKITEIPKITDV